MTKRGKRLVSSKDQLNLFDLLLQEQAERQQSRPGRLNLTPQINAAIKGAIKNAPKSRETIADEMTDLTGERITVTMINNWTADSHPHDMPRRFYAAFCVASGDIELIRIQAEAAGVFTLPGPDALRAEIQKLDEQTKELQAEKKKRQIFLQELEGKK
ncbi:MAG: hypothetical protein M0T70_06565 [Geobacteraceae bacterium]|nr:hypothetical protein [Geobacteraceae bacterium]